MRERRSDIIELDHRLLSTMLEPIFPDAHVAEVQLLSGGFSNSNYHIRFAEPGISVVLRLHAGEGMIDHAYTTAQKEWEIMHLLQQNQAVVLPEPLYADLNGTRMGRPYTIMSFVAGERLSDLLVGRDRQTVGACAYAAGQTLAALHAVTFPHPGFFGPNLTTQPQVDTDGEGWRDYIAQCLTGHSRTWLGAELSEKLWQFVLAHQAEVATLPAQTVLVHADYNGKNILMQTTAEGWQVAAVLDWEFAFAGSPLFDIGIFLRHEDDLSPDYAQEFERGYRAAGGALPPNWRRLGKLLDLLNLCEFLNTPHSRPRIVAEMIQLIEALLSI